MSEAIACKIFNKEASTKYHIQDEVTVAETDLLYIVLCDLITKNHINHAESLLFDMIDPENSDHLKIATDFYSKLTSMTDEELADADFTRKEIDSGLNEVKTIFGLSI